MSLSTSSSTRELVSRNLSELFLVLWFDAAQRLNQTTSNGSLVSKFGSRTEKQRRDERGAEAYHKAGLPKIG